TYDGANLRMYVNGTLVRTQAVTGSIVETSGALRIGGNSVWGEYFSGLIDEVRIYSRALSQSEIQTDMNLAIGGQPMRVQVAPPSDGEATPVTTEQVAPVVQEAVALWKAAGIASAGLRALSEASLQVIELP